MDLNATSYLLAAQIFKIAAGLAQSGFALWLVIRATGTRVNLAFALAFGANGVAYAIFNLIPPALRNADSWAAQGWGMFNWVAAVAMVSLAVFFARAARRRVSTWLAALAIALPVLGSEVIEARERGTTLLVFGGTAVYPATAFALALFPLLFAMNPDRNVRTRCALLAAALSINSVDHLGAGVIQPGPLSPEHAIVQIGAMSVILGLWVWNTRQADAGSLHLLLIVVFFMLAPFLAGVMVRLAVGSYRGVQEMGFIGAGRFLAVGMLVYGMCVRGLFYSHAARPCH